MLAAQNKASYAWWVWLTIWCEAGHFAIVPNVLKQIFGQQATSLYGLVYSYAGIAAVTLLILLQTPLSTQYYALWFITTGASCLALILLFCRFD